MPIQSERYFRKLELLAKASWLRRPFSVYFGIRFPFLYLERVIFTWFRMTTSLNARMSHTKTHTHTHKYTDTHIAMSSINSFINVTWNDSIESVFSYLLHSIKFNLMTFVHCALNRNCRQFLLCCLPFHPANHCIDTTDKIYIYSPFSVIWFFYRHFNF